MQNKKNIKQKGQPVKVGPFVHSGYRKKTSLKDRKWVTTSVSIVSLPYRLSAEIEPPSSPDSSLSRKCSNLERSAGFLAKMGWDSSNSSLSPSNSCCFALSKTMSSSAAFGKFSGLFPAA